MSDTAQPVPGIATEGLTKSFPGVLALEDFSFDVAQGEVHGLVGQNGAGKSTLIKLLAGLLKPDSGTILLDGRPTILGAPAQSTDAGIAVVHQDVHLVDDFTVGENMLLGLPQPLRWGLFVDERRRNRLVQRICDRLETEFRPQDRASSLSAAQRQMVALGRALMLDPRCVIMDEPTASLGAHEVTQVLDTVRRLRDEGRSVIYVSHRLQEVGDLADRVTVMRDGRKVTTVSRAELDHDRLVELIIGRPTVELVRGSSTERGGVVLQARGLSWRQSVREVDLDLYAGEVTGLAGLVGSGRSEVAQLLFGALRPDAGTVEVEGQRRRRHTPVDGIRHGIALLPEDRRGQAGFVEMSVRENLVMASKEFAGRLFVARAKERAAYAAAAKRFGIVSAGSETKLANLSGGNQQKVLIAKWLQTGARVFILDEPTQGVDVGAQEEIHAIVRELASSGCAVLYISSDLDETLRVSDRVLVLREGELVGDLAHEKASLERVLRLCFGRESGDLPPEWLSSASA